MWILWTCGERGLVCITVLVFVQRRCVCYLTASRPAALKTVFSKDLVFFSAQTHTHTHIHRQPLINSLHTYLHHKTIISEG